MKNRVIAASTNDGRIVLVEEKVPDVPEGYVQIEVKNSLVSPGTELGGWRRFYSRRSNPTGPVEPRKFGYSNAGVVKQVGDGVTTVKPGDRVAAIGAGYALHSNIAVVPHNLCFPLPDGLTYAQGSYAMLAATALHALRRGEPEIGEFTAIVGLGILGQIAAVLYRLAGSYVMGWDTVTSRLDRAHGLGIHATVEVAKKDPVSATTAFTGGAGLDAAVIAYGGDATETYTALENSFKLSPDTHRMGRIVVVGGATFTYPENTTNIDVRRASRTGPGYHDVGWEIGPDYPAVFMRWTTRTNVALCFRLMEEGKLPVDELTTHTIPLADAPTTIDNIISEPDAILGVVFEMNQ